MAYMGGGPCKYICSLDEFIEKREQYPQIDITRGKGGLSEETVKIYWNRFNETKKD